MDSSDAKHISRLQHGHGQVDVSAGYIAGQEGINFNNKAICENGMDDTFLCEDAQNVFDDVQDAFGCCNGEHFLHDNAECIGMYDEQKYIDLGMGKVRFYH